MRELPRRGGDRDNRWVHLLGDQPGARVRPGGSGSDVDRESAPSQGAVERDAKVRTSYDAIAGHYAEALADELDGLPFERWLLDRVAEHAGADPVVEVGGQRHATADLAAAGVDASGIDQSLQTSRRVPSFPTGGTTSATCGSWSGRAGLRWSAVLGWYL